jgi:hypothetical protein
MPTVRFALISDGIEISSNGKTFSILQAFETKLVEEFPVNGSFFLTVFWDGSSGDSFNESFTITDDHNDVIASKSPARVFFEKSRQITFTRFVDVLFPNPDIYTINIHAEGVIVSTLRFAVAER